MSGILAYEDAIDIGGGRGRLAAPAAASLARVDVDFRSAFGRAADINEAWRSPEQADKNFRAYQAWLAYQAGRGPKVPWAPIGYAAKDSIHCRGYAVDTDDTSDAHMRIWNDHGWFWTVYRWINGKWTLVERWHLEYDASRDNHRHDPAPAGGAVAPNVSKEDGTMQSIRINGNEYGIDTEFITHYGTTGQAKITRQVTSATDELHNLGTGAAALTKFSDLLNGMGIPADVLDNQGRVKNPQSGKFEANGTWSRRREILAELASLRKALGK
jgi:hypothetical protein